MTKQYDINLTDGTAFATLYAHEVNGPDNISTPRRIAYARPQLEIVNAVAATRTLTFDNDVADFFTVGESITIVGSSVDDGSYTVSSVEAAQPGSTIVADEASRIALSPSIGDIVYQSDINESFEWTGADWISAANDIQTRVVTNTAFPSNNGDGKVNVRKFVVYGDLQYRFVAGFEFTVQESGEADGTYTVSTPAYYDGHKYTFIPVVEQIRDDLLDPIALPYGEIAYTNPDVATSLNLPGKGTLNYGELVVENMVRLLENFAAPNAPELNPVLGTSPAATPLAGQQWYNTTPGEEAMMVFKNGEWTSDIDIDDGALVFRDPENSNSDVYLTAAEYSLPNHPTPDLTQPGMVVYPAVETSPGNAIFRVLSTDGNQRLRIEHSGALSTTNVIDVRAETNNGESNIRGTLGITGLPGVQGSQAVMTNTLTVQGSGIDVNTDPLFDAVLNLNSVAGQSSKVTFNTAGVERGQIVVNDAIAGAPLSINGTSSANVLLAYGGGNVGINTNNPSAPLQVNDFVFIGEGVGNANNGSDIRFANSGVISSSSDMVLTYQNGVLPESGGFIVGRGSDSLTGLTNDLRIDQVSMVHYGTNTHFVNGTTFVGFGTSTPTSPVHVRRPISSGIEIEADATSSYIQLKQQSNTALAEIAQIGAVDTSSKGTPYSGASVNSLLVGTVTSNDLQLGTNSTVRAQITSAGVFETYYDADLGNGTLQINDAGNVGINVYPTSSVFEVNGDSFFDGPVGINTAPPSDGITFLSVGGDAVFSGGIGVGGATPVGTGIVASGDIVTDGVVRSTAVNYDQLVTNDSVLTNKKYVDDAVASISWREPVRVIDTAAYSSSAAFPVSGVIDGITLSPGDRVLFSQTALASDKDVFEWDGSTWTKVEDLFEPGQVRSTGDTVYIKEGSAAGSIYAYAATLEWESIRSVTKGMTVLYENVTATNGQDVITLQNISYVPTTDGSRVLIFRDGEKMTYGVDYTELNTTQIQLTSSPTGGEHIEFYAISSISGTGALDYEYRDALGGATSITFTDISYVPGANNLLAYRNGQKLVKGVDYNETSPTQIEWIGGTITNTDNFEFYAAVPITVGTSLEHIENVSSATPQDGQVLVFDAITGFWVGVQLADLMEARASIDDLSDVTTTGVQDGDVLVWDETASQWVVSSGKKMEEIVGVTGVSVYSTTVPTKSKTSTNAFIQVFLNGILQREGAGGNFDVTGPNQITFGTNPAVATNDHIAIYVL